MKRFPSTGATILREAPIEVSITHALSMDHLSPPRARKAHFVLTHRRLVAIIAALFGASMLAAPEDWPINRFGNAFAYAEVLVPWLDPRATWGIAFALTGLCMAVFLRPWAAMLLGGCIGTWAFCAALGIVQAWIDGEQTPTAPAGWLLWAGALITLWMPDIQGRPTPPRER